MNKIQIIAHRGNFLPEGPIPEVQNQYQIPENTQEAFKRAFQNNWGIETDIRVTKEGNFVVIHDNNTLRFSGKKYVIDRMSITQIKQLGYKTNLSFKIPTLSEFCQLAKKYNTSTPVIAFQIKRGQSQSSGIAVGRAIAKRIQQHGLVNSIIFDATFAEAKKLHQEFPWLNLSVSVGEKNYSPTIYTPSQVLTKDFTLVYTSIWADEWRIAGSIYNEEMFKRLRNEYSGRIDVISPELHYNENHQFAKNPTEIKQLWQQIISWKVINGICTDYPSVLQSIL